MTQRQAGTELILTQLPISCTPAAAICVTASASSASMYGVGGNAGGNTPPGRSLTIVPAGTNTLPGKTRSAQRRYCATAICSRVVVQAWPDHQADLLIPAWHPT